MKPADQQLPGPFTQAQTPCPSCGTHLAVAVCDVDGKTGQPLSTIMCGECGLGRIDPLPDRLSLERWYRDAYRQEYKSSFHPGMRHVLRAGRNARERWLWLTSRVHLPHGLHRTLDVGSSSGEYVFLMHQLGHQAKGIEPHAGYAAYARQQLGLDILHGSFLEHAEHLPAQSVDLITLFHVLEHLVSPVETLASFRRLLVPEGLLFIEVPGSTRMCGRATLFFKAHALHFTGPTLQAVVERAGFEVLSLEAPWNGNINLVAKPSGRSQEVVDFPGSVPPDDSMWRAAQMRTPSRYFWRQVTTAAPVRKLWRNVEERHTAKRFLTARECLAHIYSDLQSMPAAR